MSVQILEGDCRDILKTLPDNSVHCCVTSPPYFGLRDYGVAGQIGLEDGPDAFVAQMVEVFREVHRVLRDDGTLWLNLGDSYSTHAAGKVANPMAKSTLASVKTQEVANESSRASGRYLKCPSLPEKNLLGIPWRVAFALQADGWYLRQDIIWSKPNPMPESVQDRCTKAHEYLFLLSKSERYFYDADAIREAAESSWDPDNCKAPDGWDTRPGGHGSFHREGRQKGSSGNKARKPATERGCPADGVAGSVPWEGTTRNRRSVWTVATQPFSEAHFATFPPELIEPCIKAGSRAGDTVLDPFGGAGTTGLVADRFQRNAILIELNPSYAAMARNRIQKDSPLFAEVS